MSPGCAVEGCGLNRVAKGYCAPHYKRFWKYGDALADRPPRTPVNAYPPVAERFWAKVRKETDGCWVWTASLNPGGYGQFNPPDRTSPQGAHRWAYESVYGVIPTGLDLDHLCRNRACVRPDHLEAVTRKVNLNRGLQSGLRTHCFRGHEYTPETTRIRKDGSRICTTCLYPRQRANWHRWAAKKRASR